MRFVYASFLFVVFASAWILPLQAAQLGVQFTSDTRIALGHDKKPPTVAITSPASGSTVAGTIAVTATASAGAGVAGVQLKLDGLVLGAEDTTTPYSVLWDTTAAANNSSHTLTAVARDTSGNRTTSAPVTVTVFNGVTDNPVVVENRLPGSGNWQMWLASYRNASDAGKQ